MHMIRVLHITSIPLLCSSLLLGSTLASAHHSFAMFDSNKSLTLTGTVKDVAYANPHVWVYLDVVDGQGRAQTWGMEGGNLGGLYRQGWYKASVKTGDKIKMQIHPLKDGTPGGQIMGVTMEDGRVFGRGGGAQQ